MVEDANTGTGSVEVSDSDDNRDRSTVKFPYFDLQEVLQVASVLHNRRGGACETGELAAELNQSVSGGSFRLRMSAARMYGLIDGRGHVKLTDLGRQAIDPNTAAEAVATAFLKIPLYFRLFQEYKNGQLPDAAGLEQAMLRHGVTQNQVSRARQVFLRAAQQAGFFSTGRGRLVRPATGPTMAATEPSEAPQDGSVADTDRAGREKGDPLSDPMLAGLMRRMLPEEGKPFSAADRRLFFTALAVNLDVIYGPPSDGHVDPQELANLYVVEPKSSDRTAIEAAAADNDAVAISA